MSIPTSSGFPSIYGSSASYRVPPTGGTNASAPVYQPSAVTNTGSSAAGNVDISTMLNLILSMLQAVLGLASGQGAQSNAGAASGTGAEAGGKGGAKGGANGKGAGGIQKEEGMTPPANAKQLNASGASVGGSGSDAPSPSGHADLDKWDPQIQEAAKSTGLPANYIKATLWAESRGNPNDPSQNPDGQHTDEGVMQISDYTYGDVMQSQPNAPRGLKAGNPADNIMMGAWELKDKFEKNGQDFSKTSAAYVGTGNQQYPKDVLQFMDDLNNGRTLKD